VCEFKEAGAAGALGIINQVRGGEGRRGQETETPEVWCCAVRYGAVEWRKGRNGND
jgi:hypothetical protein